MFSKDLELTIGQCYKEAREQRHEFMTVELAARAAGKPFRSGGAARLWR